MTWSAAIAERRPVAAEGGYAARRRDRRAGGRYTAPSYWRGGRRWVTSWPGVPDTRPVMANADDFLRLAVPGSRWIERREGERLLCTVRGFRPYPVVLRGPEVLVPYAQAVTSTGDSYVETPLDWPFAPDNCAAWIRYTGGDTIERRSTVEPDRVIETLQYLGTIDEAPEQPMADFGDVEMVEPGGLRAGDVVYGPYDRFSPVNVGLTVVAVDVTQHPGGAWATIHTHEGWPLSVPARQWMAVVRGRGWVDPARVYLTPRLEPPAPVTGSWEGLDRAERRRRWDAFVDQFGLGPSQVDTAFGPVTPWPVSEFHPDPARRMAFFTGVGHPYKLSHSPIPLFLSAATLAEYKTTGARFPVQLGQAPWAGDCGSYAALMLNKDRDGHPWSLPADRYAELWLRLVGDVGPPEFVAVQDHPCEPPLLARVGTTVGQHQQWTTESYLYLSERYPQIPWLPILQGWLPWQYQEHFELYRRYGVDLAGRWVGIGSVCRRGSQTDIARVFGTLASYGMRMHGFGVSINGLRLAGHLLYSSDSQAWSSTARAERIRLPGCTHLSRPDPVTGLRVPTDCRNCFRYAVHYREEVLEALRVNARSREARDADALMLDLDGTLC